MSAVSEAHLQQLYEQSTDPWNFRHSPYELAKFKSSIGFLGGRSFASILELGCGNGEFARLLAQNSAAYTGLDAVEKALDQARRAVPDGEFFCRFLPCELPAGEFELIVLSEILYFLDGPGIESLAAQISRRWPHATLLCVNYLGPSGNALQGDEAAARFRQAITKRFACDLWVRHPGYLLERFVPLEDARDDGVFGNSASKATNGDYDRGARSC